MDVTVLEEVLLKSAPPLLRTDPKATRQFIDSQIAQIRATFQNMRSDETLVHTDAVKSTWSTTAGRRRLCRSRA
jgi:hypothetical protein